MNLVFARGLWRPERLVVLIALGVSAIALAALVGWQVGNVILTSVVVGDLALQPTTALALIVGSVGLLAGATGRRWMSQLAGVVLLAACAVWLFAYASPHAVPIDLLLFRRQVLVQSPLPMWPGRPSIITCIVIGIFAASLLGVGHKRPGLRLAAVTAASAGALLASLSILPYLLQDPSQLAVLHRSLRIALNTSIGIGALCAGVLILKRDTGWVRLVAGGGERGRIARLLAPVAMMPVAISMIANIGVRIGVYGADVRMLLILVSSSVTLLFLAFWAARMLGRGQTERDGLVSALQRSTVIIVDAKGKITYWSAACEALYGWTAADAVGRYPVDFLRDGPPTRERIAAAINERGEWRGEALHRTKDGETRWVTVQWVRQAQSGDGQEFTVGTISDITELKLVEASLRESQERLALAVGAYDLGVCDIDILSETIIADEGLERMFDVASGAMNGPVSAFRGTYLGEDVDRARDMAAGAIANKVNRIGDDLEIRRPDGEVRHLHGVRRFFYSPEGEHIRTIGIYRDVTEERHAQQELALRGDHLSQLSAELAHVSRLSTMSEMAAALAHELNQPLTAIGNSVGALKIMLGDKDRELDDLARARVVRAANQAESQAVRAGEIVRRLRDFIARGEADARIEALAPLIEDSVALGAPNARSEQIEIHLSLSPDADLILADRIQIQQILVNLIRNASEAMRDTPAPRVLTISTAVKQGMVELAVRDSGPGVSTDVAGNLFSPLLSTKTTGMGVGLSICRRIVEAHGGQMWLEQSAGPGADFRFTVPLIAKELRHAI